MASNKAPQMTYYSRPPSVCPKPCCGNTSFVPHEDGWQCLNCMKIIYDDEPLPYIANNRPERIGQYNYHDLSILEDAPGYSRSDSEDLGRCRDPEWPATEYPALDDEVLGWFSEYDNFVESPGTNGLFRTGRLLRGGLAWL